jgi:hypothetical protein
MIGFANKRFSFVSTFDPVVHVFSYYWESPIWCRFALGGPQVALNWLYDYRDIPLCDGVIIFDWSCYTRRLPFFPQDTAAVWPMANPVGDPNCPIQPGRALSPYSLTRDGRSPFFKLHVHFFRDGKFLTSAPIHSPGHSPVSAQSVQPDFLPVGGIVQKLDIPAMFILSSYVTANFTTTKSLLFSFSFEESNTSDLPVADLTVGYEDTDKSTGFWFEQTKLTGLFFPVRCNQIAFAPELRQNFLYYGFNYNPEFSPNEKLCFAISLFFVFPVQIESPDNFKLFGRFPELFRVPDREVGKATIWKPGPFTGPTTY